MSEETASQPTLDVIMSAVGQRIWTLAPEALMLNAHRDITFRVTWQDVMQAVEDGLCEAFGVRFAVRHQTVSGPGVIGGLYTDGPVYATRHEAEAEADRLHAAHPDHEHSVVETHANAEGDLMTDAAASSQVEACGCEYDINGGMDACHAHRDQIEAEYRAAMLELAMSDNAEHPS